MAIYWPTPGFKGRTFKFCVPTGWDFNFCVRSSPLRGRPEDKLLRMLEEALKLGLETKRRHETSFPVESKNMLKNVTTCGLAEPSKSTPSQLWRWYHCETQVTRSPAKVVSLFMIHITFFLGVWRGLKRNEGEWNGKVEIRKADYLAVGEAYKTIYFTYSWLKF